MMNEEPTPRKSDIFDVIKRNSSVNNSNNNLGGGKTFDLRKSMDGVSGSGRQVVIYEPIRQDALMSVIEEEKELTEIAGDYSMENSTGNL